MTVATQTLEGQLDALIAEHGLTSVGLRRIRMDDGTHFWSVHASGSGLCGANRGACDGSAQAELKAALANLNEKRARPVVVPELALLDQAA